MNPKSVDIGPLHKVALARPSVVIAVAMTCLVIAVLLAVGAPWWSLASVAAGFAAGCVPALIEAKRRRQFRLDAGSERSRNRPYVVPIETPPPPPDFRGRGNELKQLYDILTVRPAVGPAAAIITGPPGVGKSALAKRFAAIYGNLFPDGQLFATLNHWHERSLPEYAILGRFVNALQFLDDRQPDDLAGRLELYRSLTADRRVLVIIDDACHAECVSKLLPADRNCAAIITSRVKLECLSAISVSLGPLPERDAIGLLQSVAGEERIRQDPQAAKKIAGGGHPLTVRLAGTALETQPYLPLGQAVARMKEQWPLPDKTPEPVLKARLDLSYALLASEESKALRCLGLLCQPVFSPWELAALMGPDEIIDEPNAIRLSDNLAQSQLVRRTSGGRAGVVTFELHEHVLEYAEARMLAETKEDWRDQRLLALTAAREARRRLADGLAGYLNVAVPALKDKGQLDKAIDDVRDAHAMAEENGRVPEVSLALATLADLQVELGNTDDAQELAEAARELSVFPGPVRALRCLGKVMRRMRQLDKALAYLAEALPAARDADNIAEVIRILIEQSAALALTTEPARSLAVADEAVALCRQHPDYSMLLSGASWARGNALLSCGRADEAAAFLAAAADTAPDDQALWRAWIYWLHGRASLKISRFETAAESATEAIDAFSAMAHRYGVAYCRVLLGTICEADDSRLDEAIQLLSDALETFQNCSDPWIEGDAMRTLASAMLRKGRPHEAARLLQEAARIFETLGDETSLSAVRERLESARAQSRWRGFHLTSMRGRQIGEQRKR